MGIGRGLPVSSSFEGSYSPSNTGCWWAMSQAKGGSSRGVTFVTRWRLLKILIHRHPSLRAFKKHILNGLPINNWSSYGKWEVYIKKKIRSVRNSKIYRLWAMAASRFHRQPLTENLQNAWKFRIWLFWVVIFDWSTMNLKLLISAKKINTIMMLAFSATVFGAARASPRCCKQLSFGRMGSKLIIQLMIFQFGRSNRNMIMSPTLCC